MIVVTLPAAVSGGKEREGCHVCGMWIDLYMRTRHLVTHTDGSGASFCSISCTAKYLKKNGARVQRVMAADYLSMELIQARSAFYLSGSDVPGVMTYTSRIAFSSRERAEEFRGEHGGTIISFQKALEELDGE